MSQMKHGWIKLDRKLLDWEWYKNSNVTRVFIHLLLIANIEPTSYQGVLIDRGSCHVTAKELADALGLTERQIRSVIQSLIKSNTLSITRRSKFSIISILHYDDYQGNCQSLGKSKGKSKSKSNVNPSYNNKKHSKECQRNTLLECKEEEGRQKSDKTDSASSSEEIPNWTPEGRYMPIIYWTEDEEAGSNE